MTKDEHSQKLIDSMNKPGRLTTEIANTVWSDQGVTKGYLRQLSVKLDGIEAVQHAQLDELQLLLELNHKLVVKVEELEKRLDAYETPSLNTPMPMRVIKKAKKTS